MAGSMRDQLLKMGVVDKKKAKKVQQQKRQDVNKNRKAVKSGKEVKQEGVQQDLEKLAREKQQRDLELNKRRDEARAKKALQAEVKQIIETNTVEIPNNAELAYNFTHDSKIRKIYVTDEQHKQLTKGQLAIAVDDKKHRLIPDKVAEKVETRLPSAVVRIQAESKPDKDETDPYAEYEIPDDLMW